MNKLLMFGLFVLLVGCSDVDVPIVGDIVKEEKIESPFTRAESLMFTIEEEGWERVFDKKKELEWFYDDNVEANDANRRGFSAGWRRKFRTDDEKITVYQSIAIYNKDKIHEVIEDNREDMISGFGTEEIEFEKFGDDSIAYVRHEDSKVVAGLEAWDYYKLKFIKDDVHEYIYVRVPMGEDGAELLETYGRIAEEMI